MEALLFYQDKAVGWKIKIADTYGTRLKGLLFRKSLGLQEGLLLVPCRQVHTFFMAFPIDVVFLDQNLRVLDLVEEMAPGRISRLVKEARQVLELPAGTVSRWGLARGNAMQIQRG